MKTYDIYIAFFVLILIPILIHYKLINAILHCFLGASIAFILPGLVSLIHNLGIILLKYEYYYCFIVLQIIYISAVVALLYRYMNI